MFKTIQTKFTALRKTMAKSIRNTTKALNKKSAELRYKREKRPVRRVLKWVKYKLS